MNYEVLWTPVVRARLQSHAWLSDLDWAHFDDARNWLLVEALLEDKDVSVHYLFVSNPLKARLLQEGARRHATKEQLNRAAFAMMGSMMAIPCMPPGELCALRGGVFVSTVRPRQRIAFGW